MLDDDQFSENCEFTVIYDGSEEQYKVKLVEEYKNHCVIVDGTLGMSVVDNINDNN